MNDDCGYGASWTSIASLLEIFHVSDIGTHIRAPRYYRRFFCDLWY